MKAYIILTALAIASSVFLINNFTSNSEKQLFDSADLDYTFYVYEREVPATICRDPQLTCKKQYMNNYQDTPITMHGLWPSGKPSDACYQPQECTSQKYDQSLLEQPLLDMLNENFVGLYSDATGFRGHEFEKHGACIEEASYMDGDDLENFYFGQIETLNDRYNLDDALSRAGVVPSEEAYTFDEIHDAIEYGLAGQDFDVDLRCIYLDHIQYLASIRVYLDRDFELIKNQCVKSKGLQQQKNYFNMFQDKQYQLQAGQGQQPCNSSKTMIYPPFDWSYVQN